MEQAGYIFLVTLTMGGVTYLLVRGWDSYRHATRYRRRS